MTIQSGKPEELEKWLKENLRKDYLEYAKFYGLARPNLKDWLLNVMSLDPDFRDFIIRVL